MNADTLYYSVGRSVSAPFRQAEVKIKRSRFIASLAYAGSMAEAKAFISQISKENKQATHNCWAYIVGEKGEISHASDAGEPAGTAGKPMLNALHRHGMTCVAAVVTRYYGGVKLGVRGLIDAYALAVEEALAKAPLVPLVKTDRFRVTLAYDRNDLFLNQAAALGAVVLGTEYLARITHEIEVDQSKTPPFASFLRDCQCQGLLTFVALGADYH